MAYRRFGCVPASSENSLDKRRYLYCSTPFQVYLNKELARVLRQGPPPGVEGRAEMVLGTSAGEETRRRQFLLIESVTAYHSIGRTACGVKHQRC